MQIVTREPIGVIACIIPFNFPCDLYDQKVAPALMMGNAALVLPSSDNPLTLMKLTEMLVEAGVPDGVIQCVTAPGAVKSTAVADPRVHLVTLTGSTEVGIDTAQDKPSTGYPLVCSEPASDRIYQGMQILSLVPSAYYLSDSRWY